MVYSRIWARPILAAFVLTATAFVPSGCGGSGGGGATGTTPTVIPTVVVGGWVSLYPGLSVSPNGGASWNLLSGLGTKPPSTYTAGNPYSIQMDDKTHWTVAGDKGLAMTSDGGATWFHTLDGIWIRGYSGAGLNLFAASDSHGLYASADGALTWTQPAALATLNLLCVAQSGSKVYVGTPANGLAVSNDTGKTWSFVTTANGIASNNITCVTTLGSNGVFIGTDKGLNISLDGGATWKTTLAGSSLLSIAVSGSIIAAGTYGGVDVSLDAGATWSTYGSTTPNFTANRTPGVAIRGKSIYTATWGGANVSNDLGKTWQTYNKANTNAIDSSLLLAIAAAP